MKAQYPIAVAVAIAAGAWILSGTWEGDGVGGAPPPNAETRVAVEAVPEVRVRNSIAEPRPREIVATGHTAASRTLEVRAETAGRVAAIAVEEGARVARGDLLLRLAPDDREARLEEARASLRQRQIEFDAGEALGERGFRAEVTIAANAAELAAARARVRAIELDIERTAIRAPFDGIVEAVPVEVGTVLAVGAEVATLVDLDPIKVVARIPEQAIDAVAAGAVAGVRLIDGRRVDGVVSYVGRVASPDTRTFRVEVEVDNPEAAVAAGLTAEIRLPVGQVMAHRVSPAILSLSDDGLVGVRTVDADDRVTFRPVEIVESASDGVWLGGLPETMTVIIVGQEFVADGQRVRPVRVAAEEGR